MYCRGNNHCVGVVHLTGVVSHKNHRSGFRQMRGHMARVQIGTAHIVAAFDKHIGDRAHTRAANADKVYIMQIS